MNPALTRKEREIEEREKLILDVARTLLLERGYLGLTMDRVAEATEYSKGTIYHHFTSKEDLIAGLAVQSLEKRVALFERASTFNGRARERMYGVGLAEELFVQLYPQYIRSEQIIHAASLQAKTATERQEKLVACNMSCKGVVTGIIRDAIAHGDLVLKPGTSPEGLSLSLWALYEGTFGILTSGMPAEMLGVPDPMSNLRTTGQLLLDGYGWQPLSDQWDYEVTHQRIIAEIFPQESRLLALA